MTRRRAKRPAPDITRVSFPLLAAFVRGSLHEQWQAEYETAAEARDAFVRDLSAGERRAFAMECEAFLALTAGLDLAGLLPVLRESLESGWAPGGVEEVRAVLAPAPSP